MVSCEKIIFKSNERKLMHCMLALVKWEYFSDQLFGNWRETHCLENNGTQKQQQTRSSLKRWVEPAAKENCKDIMFGNNPLKK